MRRFGGVVAVALLLSVAACSGDDRTPDRTHAVASIAAIDAGHRVVEIYRHTGDVKRAITLRPGWNETSISSDCVGDGSVTVALGDRGTATQTCSSRPGRGGRTYWGGLPAVKKPTRVTVTISPTANQEWSVAIDAGPKLTSN